MRKALFVAAVVGLCVMFCSLLWAGEKAAGEKANTLVKKGEALYVKNNCKVCHIIAAKGGKVGPDLSKEGTIEGRSMEWHLKHFKDPKSVVPGSKMPASKVPDEDLKALAAYMMSLK